MESKGRNLIAATVTVALLAYGLLLLATTFTYYCEVKNTEDLTRMLCSGNVTVDKVTDSSWNDTDFKETFCDNIETWKTCSILGFIVGLGVVAYSIHCWRSLIIGQGRLVDGNETRIPLYSHLLVGVQTVTLFIMIFLLGSKALEVHQWKDIPWFLQPGAAMTLFLLSLPSFVGLVFLTLISVKLLISSFCSKEFCPRRRFQGAGKAPLASV